MPLPRGHVSLARALSKRGLASRAEAERLIRAGRVRVDGQVVREPMTAVVPERLAVTIDEVVPVATAARTILLHKPRGVLTTRNDPEGGARSTTCWPASRHR
jgi:23S rRNA pseudouridine2605 synthase